MASVDLGRIKFKWQGTYSGGTAYTPDDVVYYVDNNIGSSYICVTASTGNAPSSGGTAHSSWNYLAKGMGGGNTLQSQYARTNSVITSSNNYGDKYYGSNYGSSNGTQILSISITPQSSTSHFQIWYSGDHACGGNAHASSAIFHGSTRVTTTCTNNYAGDASGMHMSAWIDTTGLSGSQTIQVRNMGSNGGHTQYVNSDHSGNNKNTYAYLQVHEIED